MRADASKTETLLQIGLSVGDADGKRFAFVIVCAAGEHIRQGKVGRQDDADNRGIIGYASGCQAGWALMRDSSCAGENFGPAA